MNKDRSCGAGFFNHRKGLIVIEQIIKYVAENWVGWLFAAMVPALGYVYAKTIAIRAGLRALLRDRILQAYNHYHEDKGYCPIYALENVEEMYKQYHALGGNGTITKLVEELKELPTSVKEKEK